MSKFKVMTVFGIRPDFIRASVLLRKMIKHPEIDLQFVYTGQHYDDNLMGVFFRELQIPPPSFKLSATGETHVQQHAKLLTQLEEVIKNVKPDVCMFLGDANAVIGCIAPLKMGIPIAHVEAGMRSYDWNMPEERNRVVIDRVSDVLYAYQHDYKYQLIREGINPNKIVVTGNTIVDVIMEYSGNINDRTPEVQRRFGVKSGQYAVMTLHRDQTMNNPGRAVHILTQAGQWCLKHRMPVILVTMPRLKKILAEHSFVLEQNKFILTEPLGMFDFMALEHEAAIEFTDSGTNQETSAIFGIPCVVTRDATERPETFDSGITLMTIDNIGAAAESILGKKSKPGFMLGDGNAANIIIEDLVARLKHGFATHRMLDPFVARHFDTHSNSFDIYNITKTGCWF